MNLHGIRQSAAAFWSERNQREQNLLAIALAVIVFGLLYVLLIDPALSGRTDLEKQLPGLRQQAAEVQALAREAGPAAAKAVAPAPPMTRDSIESSLTRRGLKPQSVTLSGDLAKVQLNGASFASTIQWLDEMHKTARVAVVEANIEVQPQPDTVNATFSLRQQRSEAAQ